MTAPAPTEQELARADIGAEPTLRPLGYTPGRTRPEAQVCRGPGGWRKEWEGTSGHKALCPKLQ